MDVVIFPGLSARIPVAVCPPRHTRSRTGPSLRQTHQDALSHLLALLLDRPCQREETPSPILQLIQGAQTPLCPAAVGLAAPNGSAAAPDPPGFTHSSRDRALLQGWDL